MAFSLISDDFALLIELPLDDVLVEALGSQIERLESGTASKDAFLRRLAQYLPPALFEALDSDLKPPTKSQLKFADDIALKLGIEIPSRALQSRAAMQAFIRSQVGKLNKRK